MPTFLERYISGEYVQVWAELLKLGPAIRREPLFFDAYAVAHETMQRVRHNVEILAKRLQAMGYDFNTYPDGTPISYPELPWTPPHEQTAEQIARIEANVGMLPLSLCAFWEEVGSINFIGTHSLLPDYSDPLVVEGIEVLKYRYEEWIANCEEYGSKESGPFTLDLAPDDLHKDNVSGGPPYSIIFPNEAIDAPFENEWHHTTFVNYLRISIANGGFPGAVRNASLLPKEIEELSTELLPF